MQEALTKFTPRENKDYVEIFMDERESEDFAKLLRMKGAHVKKLVLNIGDFILSERVVVERKTRNDFEVSLIDGRLFSQAKRMTEEFERAIIIVEGERFEERVERSALLGAVSALICDFGISVFFTKNEEKTVELLYAIAKREQLMEKREIRLIGSKKAFSLAQRQQLVLETLPFIGPKLAKALLARFKTLSAVFNASEKQLMEVEKLGEKKAKTLRTLISARYEPEKAEKA
ncbi:MAG: ERCC4 domain-containing protein [Candidatus Micrarchaeota archaeon]